jgi:hypothetical protein
MSRCRGQWTRRPPPEGASVALYEAGWSCQVATRFLLEFATTIMTMHSGDLIARGTTRGLGPLQDGEVVDFEIHGVGRMCAARARSAQAHVAQRQL